MPVIRDPLVFQDGTSQATAATPGAAAVPITIASGSAFTVTANTQVLAVIPFTTDGTLVVDGQLVAVA